MLQSMVQHPSIYSQRIHEKEKKIKTSEIGSETKSESKWKIVNCQLTNPSDNTSLFIEEKLWIQI